MLPPEIQAKISEDLDVKDVLSMRVTSKQNVKWCTYSHDMDMFYQAVKKSNFEIIDYYSRMNVFRSDLQTLLKSFQFADGDTAKHVIDRFCLDMEDISVVKQVLSNSSLKSAKFVANEYYSIIYDNSREVFSELCISGKCNILQFMIKTNKLALLINGDYGELYDFIQTILVKVDEEIRSKLDYLFLIYNIY